MICVPTPRRMALAALAAALVLCCLIPKWTRADDTDSLEEKVIRGADTDLKKGGGQGRFEFDLVTADGKPIDPMRFVRGIPGQFAVSEFPRGFAIEGQSLFEAGRRVDSQLAGGGVKIFAEAQADADGESARYASRAAPICQPERTRLIRSG